MQIDTNFTLLWHQQVRNVILFEFCILDPKTES